MPHPFVIVNTLNFNGKRLLDDCFNSYLQNDYSNYEIVVVDNGSTDGSVEYIKEKFPQVKLICSGSNLGYSAGMNIGLKYAFNERQADYVLVTNNDVRADRRVISELVACTQRHKEAGFVTGKVYYFDQPDVFQTVGKAGHPVLWRKGHIGTRKKDTGQYDIERELEWCDDIFMLVSREAYLQTGGYDTEFRFQAEDFDWQVRIKQCGFRIYYTPHAKIWHKESMTLGRRSPLKAYYDARNPLIVHMKYRSPQQFKPYFYFRLWRNIKLSVIMFLRLRWWYLFKVWQGFFSALRWGLINKKLQWRHFL